jgi:energy-coupling factor transporter ATP-binding protein EcfA2
MQSVAGMSFKYESLDAETIDDAKIIDNLSNNISKLPENIKLRFSVKTFKSFDKESYLARSEATSELGQVKNISILSIETFLFPNLKSALNPFSREMKGNLEKPLERIKKALDVLDFKNININLVPLEETEILELFELPNEVLKYPDFLSFKSELFGAIRIKSLKNTELNIETLAQLRADLPKPYELSITIQKIDPLKSEFLLRSRQNSADLKNLEDLDNSLDELTHGQEAVFDMEFIVGIKRADEKTLRKDLKEIENSLSLFSSPYIESIGNYPTWTSMHFGSFQKCIFQEQATGISFLLPLFSYGSSQSVTEKSQLKLHRKSKELDSFDFFNKGFDPDNCGNTLISGAKGSGKSLLLALMTQSILNDDNNMIFKIDVGSSYLRECEQLNGIRYNVTLDTPSGINPLELLIRAPHTQEVIQILYGFIEVLLLENNENVLPLLIKSQVTESLQGYSETRPQTPSLNDFYQNSINFPRKEYLKRWVKGGIFENVFKENSNFIENRYHYFDFESIAKAQDTDLIRGVTAALIVKYNSEVYFHGKIGKRIFLICDETKFFLNLCSPFFHQTAANARKFGHSLILINQESNGFYTVGEKGVFSDSLYRNATHIFLFNQDGEKQEFMSRNKDLTNFELEKIKNLKSHKPYYSEVFYKNKQGFLPT